MDTRHGCLLQYHYDIEISVMLIEFQNFHFELSVKYYVILEQGYENS